MKSYYKILGVREKASEEEIRTRWIELMRKLHPDQQKKGALEDVRVKEINEAYETLKHSSTRAKYDLKRAYDRKKRGFHLKKRYIPISILIVFLILGTLYIKRPRVAIDSKPITQNQTNQRNQISEKNETDQIISVPKFETSAKAEKTGPKEMSKGTVQENNKVVPQTTQINPINQSQFPPAGEVKTLTSMNPEIGNLESKMGSLSSNEAITQRPQDTVASVFSPIETKTQLTLRVNEGVDTAPARHDDLTDSSTPLAQRRNDPITPKPPIAKEEEVRDFFTNYIKRYTQRDLNGFLSLFSLRAIQNQKDGMEEIRKIYNNIFNQSQEIKYDMEDMKVEIYQNAVEVKARYELDQLLKKEGEKKIWKGQIRWVLVKENEALKILSLDYQHQKTP